MQDGFYTIYPSGQWDVCSIFITIFRPSYSIQCSQVCWFMQILRKTFFSRVFAKLLKKCIAFNAISEKYTRENFISNVIPQIKKKLNNFIIEWFVRMCDRHLFMQKENLCKYLKKGIISFCMRFLFYFNTEKKFIENLKLK